MPSPIYNAGFISSVRLNLIPCAFHVYLSLVQRMLIINCISSYQNNTCVIVWSHTIKTCNIESGTNR